MAKDSIKIRCSKCGSSNIYTKQTGEIVCRKCGNIEKKEKEK